MSHWSLAATLELELESSQTPPKYLNFLSLKNFIEKSTQIACFCLCLRYRFIKLLKATIHYSGNEIRFRPL